MANIDPFVRHMIVCDDFVPSSRNPGQWDALGWSITFAPRTPANTPLVFARLLYWFS
jgi:hypothetical protein